MAHFAGGVVRRLWAAAAMMVAAVPANAIPVTISGTGIDLQGQLFRPEGGGPFPAVVALHGCSGLTVESGALNARHRVWAQKLVQRGFVVLFPDSFASRSAGSQCGTAKRIVAPSRERVEDAVAAKKYLQTLRYVKADAVSLLGWSDGGSAVLYAVAQGATPAAAEPDFKRAVAFYPGCRALLQDRRWRARLPLAILIGAADDWTPAKPCQELAAAARANGEPVTITVYPGAYHDFDFPDLPLHTSQGPASSAGGDGGAHSGTDPAARTDAFARILELLAR